jgi:acyl carrier protein
MDKRLMGGSRMNEKLWLDILSAVIEELKLDVDRNTVSRDQSIEDLGMNSVHLMKLIYLLEDRFGVTLETQEIVGIDTLGDLCRLVEQKASPL